MENWASTKLPTWWYTTQSWVEKKGTEFPRAASLMLSLFDKKSCGAHPNPLPEILFLCLSAEWQQSQQKSSPGRARSLFTPVSVSIRTHHAFCRAMRLWIRSQRLAQINSVTCHQLKCNDWNTRQVGGTRRITRFANFTEDKWRSCEFICVPAQWGCHFKKKKGRQRGGVVCRPPHGLPREVIRSLYDEKTSKCSDYAEWWELFFGQCRYSPPASERYCFVYESWQWVTNESSVYSFYLWQRWA